MTSDDQHESSIYFIWKIGHCDPGQIQQSHQKVWTDQIHIYGSHQKVFQKVKMFKQHCQTKLSYRVFFNWYPPKKLKYGKPRLGVSTLRQLRTFRGGTS